MLIEINFTNMYFYVIGQYIMKLGPTYEPQLVQPAVPPLKLPAFCQRISENPGVLSKLSYPLLVVFFECLICTLFDKWNLYKWQTLQQLLQVSSFIE